MKLYCVSDYRSGMGEYTAGQVVDVDPDTAARLCRDSPGSFRVGDIAGLSPEETAKAMLLQAEGWSAAEEQTRDAMTTETETGIVAKDRRARGGMKRVVRTED